ncbi:MAG: hypothetical protein ABIY70_11665 [Capsulimonas sp.]|uniref:hypothetical protein n=1 Tax=Capsulimonas sp. TaxID=2494211 RepID=UPI0032642EA7
MFYKRALGSGIASLLLWAALPVVADPFEDAMPGALGAGHGIYVGDGRILDAAAPRQMTLRGHIMEFQYSPTGEKIAYEGLVLDHGEKSLAIKYVDPWRSEPAEITVAKSKGWGLHGQNPRDMVSMAGWSGDGRYLIVQRISATGGGDLIQGSNLVSDPAGLEAVFESYDTLGDLSQPKIVHVGIGMGGAMPSMIAWSPDHTRVLVATDVANAEPSEDASPNCQSAVVYRPGDDSRQVISLAIDQAAMGWLDDQSLLVKRRSPQERDGKILFKYSLAGGAEEATERPTGWPLHHDQMLGLGAFESSLIDPKSPDLSLEVVTRKLPDSENKETVEVSTIWLRSAGKKKFASTPLGVTPGPDPPHAQWSPTGQAVAFVAHGDLFVTDFVKRVASAREKLEAGEKLDCLEEREIVQTNLKQIGLGLMQYIQDYDEQLPPPSNVQDRIDPYIKRRSVFTLADSTFVYHPPVNLSLAATESPADFVIGEMDTPCAHNYLYLDGHVKSFDK